MDVDYAARIRELVASWNQHDIDVSVTFYAAEFEGTDVADSRAQHGQEGVRRAIERLYRAFPDAQFIEDELVVEGQQAVLLWTMQGTHGGRMMNIPATGRLVQVRGVSYFRFNGDKIVRIDRIWDVAGMLRAIGLLPEL